MMADDKCLHGVSVRSACGACAKLYSTLDEVANLRAENAKLLKALAGVRDATIVWVSGEASQRLRMIHHAVSEALAALDAPGRVQNKADGPDSYPGGDKTSVADFCRVCGDHGPTRYGGTCSRECEKSGGQAP